VHNPCCAIVLGPSRANGSRQLDKLVISQLGLLAQRRLARGVKLNHAEATVRVELQLG
jgi:urease gamma subunit